MPHQQHQGISYHLISSASEYTPPHTLSFPALVPPPLSSCTVTVPASIWRDTMMKEARSNSNGDAVEFSWRGSRFSYYYCCSVKHRVHRSHLWMYDFRFHGGSICRPVIGGLGFLQRQHLHIYTCRTMRWNSPNDSINPSSSAAECSPFPSTSASLLPSFFSPHNSLQREPLRQSVETVPLTRSCGVVTHPPAGWQNVQKALLK